MIDSKGMQNRSCTIQESKILSRLVSSYSLSKKTSIHHCLQMENVIFYTTNFNGFTLLNTCCRTDTCRNDNMIRARCRQANLLANVLYKTNLF